MDLTHLRQDYRQAALNEEDVAADPLQQFDHWFSQALKSNLPEPYAMTLATANQQGQPSARIVLLRGYDEQGLLFFTNYQSRKGHELAQNAHAALLFYWAELERQVRIEGQVRFASTEESDRYYASRPVGNRLGAWASPQSQAIPSRQFLEEREAQFRAQYGDEPPRPKHWGGYRLQPTQFEFWQGRPSRLHDRINYSLSQRGQWLIERLAP
ncbi:pyridoxamine 5'-phosphate oxidase [Parvibium lacunae]|uniref:Pyridoxine/pyridoxamine 5'-phosphate oxidase n=1 Tax=Parvibium lacunae TaxID=1888893 RepID=A0A368KYF5_9BURK|nr:pyridoxamine 5'-phosphate oxidase [Parvibium lacunae]RCS56475.1 pyridoxamine 5'-phosphate oxidase [Parvibium lacunae]